MKLKSLILGSVAAAGLTTGAFAADLGVLTSLDVCDTLGLSGLTISSDTNCLQISGSVDYRLRFGDFRASNDVATTYDGTVDPFANDSVVAGGVVRDLDWDSRVRAYLKAVGTASSDFGPAQAVIGLRQVDEWRVQNEGYSSLVGGLPGAVAGGDHTNGIQLEEAYVRVGDTTVLLAGMRKHGADGSVANVGDDSPFSYLFISDKIDGGGVLVDGDDRRLGGTSIQIQSDLGNGVSAGLGLENIDSNGDAFGVGGLAVPGADSNLATGRVNGAWAGTLVGVLQYAGENVSAHITGLAYGILDGDVNAYAIHAGATGTFDMFKIRGAIAYDSNFKGLGYSVVHGLVSGEASFDMFKIALSGEVANFNSQTDYSFGGKITAQVADGVSLNLDATWFRDAINAKAAGAATDTVRIQAEIAAAVTETITITAAVGSYFGSGVYNDAAVHVDNLYYGRVGVAWVPGGGFKSGLTLEANSEGGYRTEFTASKSFE
jgi:hypothetical protein